MIDNEASTCVDQYNLFMITSQTGLSERIDGIWGMSSGQDSSEPVMIIDALYNAGLITARVFAFSISSSYDSTSNFLDIGAYDTANMRNPSELIWFEAIDDFWWTNYISGIKFGPGHNLE